MRVGGGDAVELVQLAVGVAHLELVQLGGDVLDVRVDLAAAHARAQPFEHLGDRLALFRDHLEHDHERDQARVGVPVVAEVEVAGVLAAEDGVVLAHLRLDEGVADARADAAATHALDQLGHASGDDQVVEDGGAGVLLEQVARDHSRDHPAVDQLAVLVGNEHAVGIAVEGHAHIGVGLAHQALHVHHVLGLDGRGRVVREVPIGIKVEGLDLHGQALECGGHDEAGHAVAGVDGQLERPQCRAVDEAMHVLHEVRQHIAVRDPAALVPGRWPARQHQALDVVEARFGADGHGVGETELEAVVLAGVVRRRDHCPGRVAEFADGKVELVGAGHAQVDQLGVLRRHAVLEGFEERRRREAHIAAHRDAGHAEVRDEGRTDGVRRLLVYLVRVGAPHVVGLEDRGVDHRNLPGNP